MRVAVPPIELTLERRLLGERSRGSAPVVDAEAAHEHEPRRAGAIHRLQQRLGRHDRAEELLHDVAREDRGEVDHRIDSGQRGVEVRRAQVSPPGLDSLRRRNRLPSQLRRRISARTE